MSCSITDSGLLAGPIVATIFVCRIVRKLISHLAARRTIGGHMGTIVPDRVEDYLSTLNRAPDRVLAEIAEDGARRDLPLVDAEVGALLRVLATAIKARRILEIGTAIGYSGIWLAR